MAKIKRYPELFAVCTMIKNSAKPEESTGFYNAWLTSTFGKIGVLQQGAYIPSDFKEKFTDKTVTSFKALVRIVQELKPGERGGMLILHPIAVLSKAHFRIIQATGFTADYNGGSIILNLIDNDLQNSLLWMAESNSKRELMAELGGHAILPNVSIRARSLAAEQKNISYAMAKSDSLLALGQES